MTEGTDTQRHLAQAVNDAVLAAVAAGDLPDVAIPEIALERPKDASNGDFATSLPLQLARSAMKSPREIAETIISHFPADTVVEPPEVAGPGFINFRIRESHLQSEVDRIISEGPRYADITIGAGKKAQVEFVSANPTGPLHVGNGRGAAIGDVLASVLDAAGYDVQREYYVNDAGTQADVFGETLYARYQQQLGRDVPLPAEGYPGDYMVDLAKQVVQSRDDGLLLAEGKPAPAELNDIGIELMVERIRGTLEQFGVRYDDWYSERELYTADGPYERSIAILRDGGHLVEREGALWFASSGLGEEKDNVVVRSDGRPTYYASDIGYHYAKFVDRGFALVIDVWGADHHGHVSRLKTAVDAVCGHGDDLHILLYQLVTLKRGGEVVRLSKRGGDFIELDELIDEVGTDAARFFFAMRAPTAQMDFDIDLAVKESRENPVYYVQYAHARLASMLARAAEQGLSGEGGDVHLLTQPHELALIREMLRLPEVIETVATSFEQHHLTHYATSLATAFHAFNDAFRQENDSTLKVITDDEALTRARLRLVQAAKVSLGRVLDLIGVSAPEQM